MYNYQKNLLAFCLSFYAFYAQAVDYVTFTWQMTPRFNECRKLYDPIKHEYDKKIMDFSQGWVVEFRSSGNLGSIPNKLYTWEITGVGELSWYHKTYSSGFPNLITSLAISGEVTMQPEEVNSKNLNKRNDTNQQGQPPSTEPTPPSWNVAEKLPKIGMYKVKLTVSSATKSYTKPPLVINQVIQLRNIVIACLGDSFASGEGNPDIEGVPDEDHKEDCGDYTTIKTGLFINDSERYLSEMLVEPKWFEIAAHRSMSSGYALAAKEIEDRDPHSVVTFINLAVSGAKLEDGLLLPQSDRKWMKRGQLGYLKDLVDNQQIDLLLLSIGGNDIGFSNIITEATAKSFLPNNYSIYQIRITNLIEAYSALNSYLRNSNQIKIKNILLSEYPTHLFHNNKKNDKGEYEYSCGIFEFGDELLTITKKEIEFLDRLGLDLKKTMANAAAQFGWIQPKGIAQDFMFHGYCSDDSQNYWISATHSCQYQADFRGLMHPNQKGHAKIKSRVLEKIIPVLFNKPVKAGTKQTQ